MAIDFNIPAEAKAVRARVRQWVHDECIPAEKELAGGRARPRRMLYLAALAAKRCDPGLKAFVQRLLARGKPPKVAIVAVMRKLIEAANLVLSRGQPWVKQLAT